MTTFATEPFICPSCGDDLPAGTQTYLDRATATVYCSGYCAPASTIMQRRSECTECRRPGIHVDTTSGEIVRDGVVVAVIPLNELPLMVDDGGRLLCDCCAGDPGSYPPTFSAEVIA